MVIPLALTAVIALAGERGEWAADAVTRAGAVVHHAGEELGAAGLAELCARVNADVVLLSVAANSAERALACHALPQPPAVLALPADDSELEAVEAWADDAAPARTTEAQLVHRLAHLVRVHRVGLDSQRTELALHHSIDYLHKAFSAAPVGIAYCDPAGRLLLTNRALRDMIGLSDHAMALHYGQPVFDCPVFGERAHVFFSNEGAPPTQELCFTTRAGREACVDITGLPVEQRGVREGVVLVFNDVTERKRTEQAEQEQRRMAEALRVTGAALARSLDSDTVMNLILSNVGLVVPHRAANIMLITGDDVRVVFSQGYSEAEQQAFERARLSLNEMPLLEEMLISKQPQVIDDVSQQSAWKTVVTPWVRSYIGAPIVAYNRVVGFINLDSDQLQAFSARDIERLTAFTDQAAVAIENAQMFDAAYRDAHEMRTLHRATSFLFASSVFTSDNLSEIARRIAETVVGEFGQVNCSVIIISEVSSELIWLAQAGEYAQTQSGPIYLDGAGLIPEAIRTGQMVYAPDVSKNPLYRPSSPLTRSELVIPLRTAKGVYGALDLQSAALDAFDEQDRHVMLAFAERAAAAIENMRIYSDIQRRVRDRTMELNRVKERAEAILNHSSDAILLMRADARIQQTNRAFNEMFGFEPDEVYNRSFDAIASAEYADELGDALQQVVEKRGAQRVEVAAVRRDGTMFDADVMMSPILAQHAGNVSSVVCSLRDITQRKHMERELRDALMKERELSEFKSRFISRASHEFRTPLAMIATSSDLLKNYSDRMSSTQRNERLDRIQIEIAHLTAMLDDLLSISKAQEVGPETLQASPFDLGALFDEIVDDMRNGLGFDHQFEVIRAPGPFEFVGDRKLLRRALSNLISNALKYSNAGTRIGVSLTHDDHRITIVVEDSGIGIPEADQNQLFEPFHRGANVADISGTGLGLAIVKQAVELHGGAVSVQSVVAKGSRFTITLPFAPEQAEVTL